MAPAVLAFINVGVSVAQLFAGGGPSIADLLSTQAKMIKTISDQLTVIQRNLELISKRLDEVQQILGQLPRQVVEELSRRELVSLLGTYLEIVSAYKVDEQNHSIKEAQERHKGRIEDELLKPLRRTRSLTFTSDEVLCLPLISAALQAEMHGMILADYPGSTIRAALKRYGDWYDRLLLSNEDYTASGRVAKLREKRKTILDSVRSQSTPTTCLLNRGIRRDYPGEAPDFHPQRPMRVNYAAVRMIRRAYTLQKSSELSASADVGILRGAQLLVDDDLIQKVLVEGSDNADVLLTWGEGINPHNSRPDLIPDNHHAYPGIADTTRPCSSTEAGNLPAPAPDSSAVLEATSVSIVAIAACQRAGIESSNAVRQFLNDPSLR